MERAGGLDADRSSVAHTGAQRPAKAARPSAYSRAGIRRRLDGLEKMTGLGSRRAEEHHENWRTAEDQASPLRRSKKRPFRIREFGGAERATGRGLQWVEERERLDDANAAWAMGGRPDVGARDL